MVFPHMKDIHGFTLFNSFNLITRESHTPYCKGGSNLESTIHRWMVLSYAHKLTDGKGR
jgi:hypothetical protein